MNEITNLNINVNELNNPVIIGGVGGSGTRLVEEILEKAGFYMGQDLNIEKDNLWFSLLFKRPEWFMENQSRNRYKIMKSMDVFLTSMFGCFKISVHNFSILSEIIIKDLLDIYKVAGNGDILWTKERLRRMISSKQIDLSNYIGWGWKEPNTHIYIKYLCEYFTNVKYIHVIRHGLDMAYSNNKNQLLNWGKMFDVELPKTQNDIPISLLDYWIKSNKKAITDGQYFLRDNFYILNFDELCMNPKTQINNLIDFLKIDINKVCLDKLYSLPKIPKSFERYKTQDLSLFSKEKIDAVKELGFRVNVN